MNWDALHSTAFLLRIRPGMVEEYVRRHREIWPELLEAQRAQGIVRFEIFLDRGTNRVFGHILRTRRQTDADRENPVMLRWRRHMADVLEMDRDAPATDPLERVFYVAN